MITIRGCSFENNGVAISAPEGALMDIDSTQFINNGRGLEQRSREQDLVAEFLRHGVTPDELLKTLIEVREAPQAEKKAVVVRSGVFAKMRSVAEAATTLPANLATIASSPVGDKVISLLRSMVGG